MDFKTGSFLVCLFLGMIVVSTMAVPVAKKGESYAPMETQTILSVPREDRQYGGFGASNSFAQASANANSFGAPGFGGGFSAANAQASANSFGGGFGK